MEALELAQIFCITNSPHERLAFVNQRACTYPASIEGADELPRRAAVGFLCTACWHKLKDALPRVAGLILHLRATESGGQGLTERVSSSLVWQIPIPASWLAADDIMAALGDEFIPTTAGLDETAVVVARALHEWRAPDVRVSTTDGAVRAVQLVRTVQTALARWPEADSDRPMPAPLRCPACHELSLWYRAPLEYLDDLLVKCGTCGHTQDWDTFTEYTQVFTRQFEIEQKAEQKRLRAERRKATS